MSRSFALFSVLISYVLPQLNFREIKMENKFLNFFPSHNGYNILHVGNVMVNT